MPLEAVPQEIILAALAFLVGLAAAAFYMIATFEPVTQPDNPEEGTELLAREEGATPSYQASMEIDDAPSSPPADADGGYADLSPLAVF